MSRKAFEGIMAGLQDALAHAQGDRHRGRVHRIRVPMVDVRAARRKLAMTQDEFATVLSIPVSTLRKWEQKVRTPDTATRLLLHVVANEPQAVMRTIRTLRTRRAA